MTPFGPAAIAVHDDRYMFGKLFRIEPAVNLSLFVVQPRRNRVAQTYLSSPTTLAQRNRSGNFRRARRIWGCDPPITLYHKVHFRASRGCGNQYRGVSPTGTAHCPSGGMMAPRTALVRTVVHSVTFLGLY